MFVELTIIIQSHNLKRHGYTYVYVYSHIRIGARSISGKSVLLSPTAQGTHRQDHISFIFGQENFSRQNMKETLTEIQVAFLYNVDGQQIFVKQEAILWIYY